MNKIKVLLCDIGGVLLSNGWGHLSRLKAAKHFNFDFDEVEQRHSQIVEEHEKGNASLEEYLKFTVFFKDRLFTKEAFVEFMYGESVPDEGMIAAISQIKQDYHLKVVFFSNEGVELTKYRLQTFGLDVLGDFFVVSCFLRLRKPDVRFYQAALNLMQVTPAEVIYLDDRENLVIVGKELGMHAIQHLDQESTVNQIHSLLEPVVN